MAATKSSAKSVSKVSTANPSVPIQFHLRLVTVELRCALSALTVAAHALVEQNADIDADVALVLQRAASAPVYAGLERIERLLAELDSSGGASDKAGQDCVH
jgi:hypothetical protein